VPRVSFRRSVNKAASHRISLTEGRQGRRSRVASPVQSVYVKGVASPHLRPFMYMALAGVGIAVLLSRFFGIDRGLIAVLFGAAAVILFIVYTRGSGSRARADVAAQRDALYRRLAEPESDDEDG